MYEVTKDHFTDGEIPASIIQKMATKLKVNMRDREEVNKFIDRQEYKHMLVQVRKGLAELSSRTLVDTLFAVAKLHKGMKPEDFAKNSVLMPFLTFFVGDFIKEAVNRVESLDCMDIAYFSKALVNLRKLVQSNE
jgi:hypothetical protein